MRKWLFLFALLLPSAFIIAQTSVTGKVTDAKSGTPVAGASVRVGSTKSGTVTNAEGVFSIQVKPGDKLEISFIGYKSQTVTPGTSVNLTIALEQNASDLNE